MPPLTSPVFADSRLGDVNDNIGIQWTLLKHLDDLDFADDIALLSHKHKDMEEKTAILEQWGGQVDLRINHAKTETMRKTSTRKKLA